MNDFTVNITFRNKMLEQIGERQYSLTEYAEMIKYELMRIIMDVESSFTRLQGGKPKALWDADTTDAFQKIRHKLLDEANAIERLPQNLYYQGVPCQKISAADTIAKMINAITNQNN